MSSAPSLPVIDLGREPDAVAAAIGAACRDHGFFYVIGHRIDRELQGRLERLSRQFFAWPQADKMKIAMTHAGRAWRGYFPLGAELTSGSADRKEGIYFGAELPASHPLVRARTPLHGANLFPEIPEFRATVLAYLDALTELGHRLLSSIALSLGLDADYFRARYTADPLILFRIFNYPPTPPDQPGWGVGEHTDYGVLTILKQDDAGGLEVKTRRGWLAAPPIADAFVCNIGDMLERMTGGHYRSTPHRVRNSASVDRLSFPFFFDPNFEAQVRPIAGMEAAGNDDSERWDHASVHAFDGSYGDYLLAKVAKVFPQLTRVL